MAKFCSGWAQTYREKLGGIDTSSKSTCYLCQLIIT